jgi:hypothetical protein
VKISDLLVTELRARKYSNETIKSYLYYNRELCKWSGRSPLLMDSASVTGYLAFLSQERDASALTLNLAISAFK